MVLKTDVLGRVKTPAQRREQLLDEFERSGLSGSKYAELVGIKYQTFATWLQRRKRARGAYPKVPATRMVKAESVRWLEAVVQEARQAGAGQPEAIVLEVSEGGASADQQPKAGGTGGGAQVPWSSRCKTCPMSRARCKPRPFKVWWAHQDLNLGPSDYESPALTTELWAQHVAKSTTCHGLASWF